MPVQPSQTISPNRHQVLALLGTSYMENQTVCPDCGASLREIDGPVHPYIGGNAAQHPGQNTQRSAQSVTIHLMALYLILEKELSFEYVTQLLGKAVAEKKHSFRWLTPPKSLGEITVVDVAKAQTAPEHHEKVYSWARSVWNAWQIHRIEITRFAEELI